METKYITITIKEDKPKRKFFGRHSFLVDCAVFAACGVGVYMITCAALVFGGLL